MIIFGSEYSLSASCECFIDQIVAMDIFQINTDFLRIPLFHLAEWKIGNANTSWFMQILRFQLEQICTCRRGKEGGIGLSET